MPPLANQKNRILKKKRRFKKRYIPFILLLFILSCNASGVMDMVMTPKDLAERFQKASIKHYSTQTISRNGRDVFFAQTTNVEVTDSTPVFIFAHGTPGALSNSIAYLLDSTLLSTGIVVAYDRPGFGLSNPGALVSTLDGQVAALKQVMDVFKGHQLYLVGHSYGAPVILQAAMDSPDEVAGLVWLGGVVHTAWKAHAWWRKPMSYPPIKWLFPVSMNVSNHEMMELDAGLKKIENKWTEVTCPVVMIQGTKDWLAVPENTKYAEAKLEKAKYKEVVMVSDASHFFYFSQPHYVVDALVRIMAL